MTQSCNLKTELNGLTVYTILCRAGTMDNYAYILVDKQTGTSAVIDPSEPEPVIDCCLELNITPQFILNTHHHFDHTDGNLELKKLYNARIVGNQSDGERIPGFDLGVFDGGSFDLGASRAEIIDVSGHTQGHIVYYFSKAQALFTGDTLFNLCIGGLFEGTPEQMFASLQKIKALPDSTLFFPGHEYTMYAAQDAWRRLPDNHALEEYIAQARQRLECDLPVGPVPLEMEKKCNPYLHAVDLENFKRLA